MIWLLLACAPRHTGAAVAQKPPEIRFRPADAPDEDGAWLMAAAPQATWDAGLAAAAQLLLAQASSRDVALSPGAIAAAEGIAGFPGSARFSRLLTGGGRPDALLEQIPEGPVDVALARRQWGDGLVLWVLAVSPHLAELDPIPRDLPLDGALPLRVDGPRGSVSQLYLAPPDGPVAEIALSSGVTRWVDDFHTPGAYQIAVATRPAPNEDPAISLRFTVFVDVAPPAVPPLKPLSAAAANPALAEAELYAALNALRVSRGLRPVQRFELFEPLAREHAALMAEAGSVSHSVSGQSGGVAARAAATAHPRASHHENVATAASAEDLIALVETSPPHLLNLLCERCTDVSIGVALEPVLDRPPRLFATWELLEFPNGRPASIDHYNR